MTKIPRPKAELMGPCKETALLASELHASVTAIHQLHLKVSGPGSYAAHKALGEYYEQMPGIIDTFVEGYQGAREKLLDYPTVPPMVCRTPMEAVSHLKALSEKATELQKLMPFSEVINHLDEVKSLIAATKYKLLFLQ